jgi:hypothetical protein
MPRPARPASGAAELFLEHRVFRSVRTGPNEMITLNALRVLHAAGRLT